MKPPAAFLALIRRFEGLRLRLGVNNVFNEDPPLVDESLGYSPQYHGLKGREYYLQIRASF